MKNQITEVMKKAKSVLTTICIASIACFAVTGIMLLFKFFGESVVLNRLMFSFLVLAIASLLTFDSAETIARKNVLGIVALSLLVLSELLIIIYIWAEKALLESTAYRSIMVSCSAISVFLTTLSGNIVKIGKKMFVLQIIFYVFLVISEIFLSLLIIGVNIFSGSGVFEIFIACVIVAFTMFIIIKVKGRSDSFVYVSKAEYDDLKREIEELRKIVGDKNVNV